MTNKNRAVIEEVTTELNKAFRHLNEVFFEGKLVTPALTIQSKGKRSAYGWCSVNPIWLGKTDEAGKQVEEDTWEIGIASEHLTRPYMDIMQTLLHEMIHLHNMQNDIKDTSRNYTYHNKQFKKQAELHGMHYPHDKPHDKYGYTDVHLTDTTISIIEALKIDESAFRLARGEFASAESKKAKSYKWLCSCTEPVPLRTTRLTNKADEPLRIVCADCGTFYACVNLEDDEDGNEED